MKAGQISPTQAPAQSRTYSKLSANPMHEGSEPAPCGLRTSTSRRTAHSCATRRFAISCVSFFARTWRHAAASWPRVRWTGVLVTTRNSVGDTVANVPAEKGARSFSPLQRRPLPPLRGCLERVGAAGSALQQPHARLHAAHEAPDLAVGLRRGLAAPRDLATRSQTHERFSPNSHFLSEAFRPSEESGRTL